MDDLIRDLEEDVYRLHGSSWEYEREYLYKILRTMVSILKRLEERNKHD